MFKWRYKLIHLNNSKYFAMFMFDTTAMIGRIWLHKITTEHHHVSCHLSCSGVSIYQVFASVLFYFWRTNMIDSNTVRDSSLVSSGLCDSLNANHNSRVYCSIHLLCDPCLHSCRQYSMITLVPTVYWYNQLPAVSPAISDINAENVRVNSQLIFIKISYNSSSCDN